MEQAMSATPGNLFTLNGAQYDGSQLPPEGQRLLGLITEAQSELARLETRKSLLQAAQQQLIAQLKPLLPAPSHTGILGQASDVIPTTPAQKPEQEPSPLPDNLPAAVRAKRP